MEQKYSEWSLGSKKTPNVKFYSSSTYSTVKTKHNYKKRNYVHIACCKNDFENGSKNRNEITIPGIQKLLDPEYSKRRKVFWFLALVGCAMICVYQLQDRISYYFKNHVSTDVTTRKVVGADFPAITICPARAPFDNTSKYLDLVNKECLKSIDPNCKHRNFTFEELNTSLDDIWSEMGITEAAIHVMTSCVVLKSSNCDDDGDVPVNMTKTRLDTVWGACMVYYPEEPLDYKGPSYTYLDIQFNTSLLFDESYSNRMALVQIYFHPTDIIQRHEAYLYAEYLYKEYFTTIRLKGREFYYIRRPCGSNVHVTECRNACIDKKLAKIVTCKLPFIKSSSLSPCKTFASAKESYEQAEAFYRTMDFANCSCPKKCANTVFASEVDIEGNCLPNETMLTIFKGENMNEMIREQQSYNFPSLLSDIGGTLGFFMGICMLNLLEVIETITQKITSCRICCSRLRRRSGYKKITKKSPLYKFSTNMLYQDSGVKNGVHVAPRSHTVT